ncbi:hypothetical protein RQM47_14525 [Rubrivirga sp. S365]|uniref:hypothetical protein n=1 Tax=Rubrivirga sp. S365 TaxID=3076080 RepID=UPI0028CA074E|nr:hypothetical protein [Rubrivirga sp. S365]MDT7857858.1 hypothetical protein [Rubrivirga sp. S365]
MSPGPRAFLADLVDYAGLFPPAALDLGPAVRNFAAYRGGADAWMLARFIVPAGRLDDLDAFADLFAAAPPARFSVLGHAPEEGGAEAWAAAARRTLDDARAFERRHPAQVACDRFELRLPAALASDADRLAEALGELDAAFRDGAATPPRAAVEVPFLEHPGTVGPAAQAVADANGRAGRPAFALKLRCGGVTPDLVPGVEALAEALATARDGGAPFKATAGLHHPFRNDDEAVGATMHGFVNVFGGAILARVHGLSASDLAEVLDDADAAHWRLDDDGLGWRSLQTTPPEVADAREQFALSYGSCSFDEPREDLRALGWIR